MNDRAMGSAPSIARTITMEILNDDRRVAVHKALDIITSISRGLNVPSGSHGGGMTTPWRLL